VTQLAENLTQILDEILMRNTRPDEMIPLRDPRVQEEEFIRIPSEYDECDEE
jgi:hypothetical protein